MITELKAAIIKRLQPLRTRARVVADDTDGEAGSNAQIKSDYTIRVSYSGGSFTPPDNTNDIAMQLAERTFQVAIEVRDLRNEDKAVQLLEDVGLLLLGFCACIEGVIGEASLQSDRFQQNKDGAYFYVLNLSIPVRVFKKYG